MTCGESLVLYYHWSITSVSSMTFVQRFAIILRCLLLLMVKLSLLLFSHLNLSLVLISCPQCIVSFVMQCFTATASLHQMTAIGLQHLNSHLQDLPIKRRQCADKSAMCPARILKAPAVLNLAGMEAAWEPQGCCLICKP